jgi:hypothetical protein
MAREPEVVVGGEVDEPPAVALDDRLDRPVDRNEAAQQPGIRPLGEAAREIQIPAEPGLDAPAGQRARSSISKPRSSIMR